MDKQLIIDMQQMRRELDELPWFRSQLVIGLTALMQVQTTVSSPVDGCIPEPGEQPSKDAIRTYVLAMTVELMEFLQTLNWKPWKDKPALDRERTIDEFADVLAFQGIIIKHLETMGIGPVDLAEGYAKKSVVNIDRFLGKYGEEYRQQSLFKE